LLAHVSCHHADENDGFRQYRFAETLLARSTSWLHRAHALRLTEHTRCAWLALKRSINADRILLPDQPRWYYSHHARSRCSCPLAGSAMLADSIRSLGACPLFMRSRTWLAAIINIPSIADKLSEILSPRRTGLPPVCERNSDCHCHPLSPFTAL
jgi:hypothetical protein